MIDSTKLPFGGETILMLRMRKLAPEMVFVSMLPARQRMNVEPYAFVRAIPGKDYDWRFLKKLHTVVVCNANQARLGLFEQLCAEASPVQAWFADEVQGYDVSYLPTPESIERPREQWVWTLDFFPWFKSMNEEWAMWIHDSMSESAHV